MLTLKQLHIVYILYGLFFSPIAFSTFLNGGEPLTAFYHPARIIGFIILVHFASEYGRLFELLSIFKNLVGFYILLNLFFQLYKQELFGYTVSHNFVNFFRPDNELGYWYVAFILVVYLSNMRKTKIKRTKEMMFWTCICLASLIRAWAATCMVIFIIYLFLVMYQRNMIMRLCTPWSAFLANFIFSVIVIFFQIQNMFSWLIVDILHKDLTLSGRTRIWNAVIANISRKPLLGYGTNLSGRLSINYIRYNGVSSMHLFSHNIFLEVMIQGGCIALLFLAMLYIVADRKIKKAENIYNLKTMICISMFSILLMQFSEFILYEPFVNIPLILCFFYKELVDQCSYVDSDRKIGNRIVIRIKGKRGMVN